MNKAKEVKMLPVVTVQWLTAHAHEDDLVLLDTSFPKITQTATTTNADLTIPRSRFFDLKKHFSVPESPFPNTLPSAVQFEQECQRLGIDQTSKIVVFDDQGVYSSPRVWWMFKVMGHEQVAVLDGGLPAWQAEGLEVVPRLSKTYQKGDFKAKLKAHYVKDYDQICQNITAPSFELVDARSSGRFSGIDPEPRKQLKSGHIPHSVNIPYQDVLDGHYFKTKQDLSALFKAKCHLDTPQVYSCGSGLTACIVLLASVLAGNSMGAVYDGSWTEWAERQQLKTGL